LGKKGSSFKNIDALLSWTGWVIKSEGRKLDDGDEVVQRERFLGWGGGLGMVLFKIGEEVS